jgi:ABC-type branched-subunit amino acid transport system substrate-binding protein
MSMVEWSHLSYVRSHAVNNCNLVEAGGLGEDYGGRWKKLGGTAMSITLSNKFNRRTVIKAAGAIGAMQVTSPFIINALGDTPIKIGMVDPLTGVYAAVANNEVIGAKFAVEQINAKGGVLGRPLELLVEDSANDVGTGVQKTR